MRKRNVIASAGLAAALGAVGAVQATAQAGTTPDSQKVAQEAELIECPLTGEKIPPCCCPVKDPQD